MEDFFMAKVGYDMKNEFEHDPGLMQKIDELLRHENDREILMSLNSNTARLFSEAIYTRIGRMSPGNLIGPSEYRVQYSNAEHSHEEQKLAETEGAYALLSEKFPKTEAQADVFKEGLWVRLAPDEVRAIGDAILAKNKFYDIDIFEFFPAEAERAHAELTIFFEFYKLFTEFGEKDINLWNYFNASIQDLKLMMGK